MLHSKGKCKQGGPSVFLCLLEKHPLGPVKSEKPSHPDPLGSRRGTPVSGAPQPPSAWWGRASPACWPASTPNQCSPTASAQTSLPSSRNLSRSAPTNRLPHPKEHWHHQREFPCTHWHQAGTWNGAVEGCFQTVSAWSEPYCPAPLSCSFSSERIWLPLPGYTGKTLCSSHWNREPVFANAQFPFNLQL